MKKTIIAGIFVLIFGLGLVSYTSASNGYKNNSVYTPGTNSGSTTFVDANNDGVCDNYKNRPMDGTGRGQGRGMGRHR
ncbi:MAG: hypothetical protein WC850_01805 [Candidatus Gracilibacteria bacterium]